MIKSNLSSWSSPTQLNQDLWSGVLQTYCLLANGTVNTPKKMEQFWTRKRTKVCHCFSCFSWKEKKENEAIKFNRCSLACTSVTKGTIFFSSHLVIVIFFFVTRNPQSGNGFIEFCESMSNWHFSNIQNFISQLAQLFCRCLIKSNGLAHVIFSCFQMQPLTVYLKTAWMYSVSTVCVCIRNVIIKIFRYIVQSYQGCSCIIK